MFLKLVVIKWRLSDFFSDTDDWMDGPIHSGPNCKETNCFFTVGGLLLVTQTLASLTTPASCGVQKKVPCGSSFRRENMIVFRTRLLPIFSSKRFLITAPKGMTKKRHARANCCFASFACLNLLLFLPFSLPSPSSFRKLPIILVSIANHISRLPNYLQQNIY